MVCEFPYFLEHLNKLGITPIINSRAERSLSGAYQSTISAGGYFVLDCELRRSTYDIAKRIAGFLMGLQGNTTTFKIELPEILIKTSLYSGNILVKGASQTGRFVNVDGLPISTNRILNTGDFIKFANSPKIYMLSKDLNSGGAGEGLLTLHTPLLGILPSDNENVVFKNVEWTVVLKEIVSFDVNVFMRSGWSFTLEEVWG